MRRWIALVCAALGLAALAGCSASLPEGRFRCTDDTSCPGGMLCHADDHLCYRTALDAATQGDGGVDAGTDGGTPLLDAGMDAGVDGGVDGGSSPTDAGTDAGADTSVPVDAPACTASDCITLTITNAHGLGGGTTLVVEGTPVVFPAFGDTIGPLDVRLGGDGFLDVTTVGFGNLHLAATGRTTYALIVGHDASPSTLNPVARLLPTSFVAPGAGMFRAYPIDLVQDPSPFVVVATSALQTIDRTIDGGALMFAAAARTPLGLYRPAADGVSPELLLADFDPTELPQSGAYYLVLAGRPDVHLGDPNGLVAIPVVPGAHSVRSWPVVFVLNVASSPVTLCDGGASIANVVPNMILQGLPSVGPSAPSGMPITYQATNTTCTDATALRPAPLGWSPTDTTGRVLLAIEGLTTTVNWGAGAHIEAPPSTTSPAQVVTYGNGSPSHSAGFGATVPGIRAASVPGLGVAYLEWMDAPPADLRIDYVGVTYTYDWVPTTRAAAAFFFTDDGPNHPVVEISADFGQEWIPALRTPH